jgi:hypothetical protein
VAISIVRRREKGALLGLLPVRTVRREELSFSFVYEVPGAVEPSVDPVWTPVSLISAFFITFTGAGVR